MNFAADIDWEEAFTYRPGQKVELKSQPGTFDTVASYEAMMVPPIWLVNDPKPRYAHELQVISQAKIDRPVVAALVKKTTEVPNQE